MDQRKVTVYAIDVRELEGEDRYRRYYEEMPDSRKKKLNALRHDADRRRSLGAGILLKEGLLQYDIAWNDENMIEEEQGKLHLIDDAVQFNLSHSGDYAVAAFGTGIGGIGIDVEQCVEANMKVAKRFFHEKEQALLTQTVNQKERDKLFYRLWTMKESFLKVNGEGMRLPMDSFAIHVENEKVYVEEENITGDYEFAAFKIERNQAERYPVAVCIKKKMENQRIDLDHEIHWIELV